MESIKNDLFELIEIESVSGNERAIADHLERKLAAISGITQRFDDNLIWQGEGFTPTKPTIMLVAHIDTVPFSDEDWRITRPLEPLEQDGKIYGRGACDMKAGAAIILELLRRSRQSSESANIIAVFYSDEEHGLQNGIKAMIEAKQLPTADFAIVLEPTCAEVNYGVLGYLDLRVIAHGKASHSSRPEEGENAIAKLFPIVAKIQDFPRTKFHDTYSSSCVTKISGGNANNVVPDKAILEANFRFDPRLSLEELIKQLEIPAAGFEQQIISSHPGYIADIDQAMVQKLLNISGSKKPFVAPFWSDIDRLGNEMGITAVNFGPGDIAIAHAADEWVEVKKIASVYNTLVKFLEIE